MEPQKKRLCYMCIWIMIMMTGLFVCLSGMVQAKTFCIDSASDLQSALNDTSANGEADEIRLVQGIYTGNFNYEPQESFLLSVAGGYDPGCTTSTGSATGTVLDGNAVGSVFRVQDDSHGAAFSCSDLTVQNGNEQRGGGMKIMTMTGDVTLSNIMVSSNHANEFGGGVDIVSDGTITLSGSTFVKNTSDYYSGGANIHGSGTLVVNASTFESNSAQGAVGGLFVEGKTIWLTNNIISRNKGEWYHGGVLIYGEDIVFANNTISDNYADGPGAGLTIKLVSDSHKAFIYNNIMYGNSGYGEANDLYIRNDGDSNGIPSPVSVYNNNFDHTTLGILMQVPFAIDTSNMNAVNPLFVNSGAGNYQLSPGSPCIDTGTIPGISVSTDISGVSRPMGLGYDMGAYEYTAPPVPQIRADGQSGSVTAASGVPVTVSISLNPFTMSGQSADWWLIYVSPDGVVSYFDLSSGEWVPGVSPTYQGILFRLGTIPVMTLQTLVPGNHAVYFGVDLIVNGSLDVSALVYDRVDVVISQ